MLTVMLNGQVQPFKSFDFSGGEIQVKFLDPEAFTNFDSDKGVVWIKADLKSAHDVMELLMVNDAIRWMVEDPIIYAEIPYFPYARQDRVCAPGEAFSLNVMCNLINSCGFAKVILWDVHSIKTTERLKNAVNIQAVDLIPPEIINGNTVLVIPDKGAKDRVALCAERFGLPMIQADKIRDPNTGEITGTAVHSESVGDADFFVVDDICDGGRTFIELAMVLRPLTTGKIKLWVTHGIMSKGFEVFAGLIDEIYTANCFRNDIPPFVLVCLNTNYNVNN